jgi:hypothetical protein
MYGNNSAVVCAIRQQFCLEESSRRNQGGFSFFAVVAETNLQDVFREGIKGQCCQ